MRVLTLRQVRPHLIVLGAGGKHLIDYSSGSPTDEAGSSEPSLGAPRPLRRSLSLRQDHLPLPYGLFEASDPRIEKGYASLSMRTSTLDRGGCDCRPAKDAKPCKDIGTLRMAYEGLDLAL